MGEGMARRRPPLVAPRMAALAAAFVLPQALSAPVPVPEGLGWYPTDVTEAPTCTRWMKDYSSEAYHDVITMNCERVALARFEFMAAVRETEVSDPQQQEWDQRVYHANRSCVEAKQLFEAGQPREGALLAVKAYGGYIMLNSLCCTRLRIPHCTVPAKSTSQYAVRTPAGGLVMLLVVLAIVNVLGNGCQSFLKRYRADHKEEESDDDVVDHKESGAGHDDTVYPQPRRPDDLVGELQAMWIRDSSLRVLPGAHPMAGSAAGAFASLFAIFEFQRDSVKNQFEHLLSMWRSHVSTVADRSIANDPDTPPKEEFLLSAALDDLHCELLEGFCRWRTKFRQCEGARMEDSGGIPLVAGVHWDPIQPEICESRTQEEAIERSRQFLEIAVFLLVWGEGGNVRFMPEIVYFITEMALSSSGPGGSNFYGALAMDGKPHSGRFLARIIRPLYSLVFDEWYKEVKIKPNGGDEKVLHKGFARYLLPDVANYDDWNEFFCEPEEVVKGLFLWNSTDFFDQDVGDRFKALVSVHWQASLKGSQIKTHRECHSTWGVFASTHRVWLLHSFLFCICMCIATGDEPLPERGVTFMDRAILGEDLFIRLSAVGLLVPLHALMMITARGETTSNNIMRRVAGWQGWCPDGSCCWDIPALLKYLFKAVLWGATFTAPIFTYAAVRYVDDVCNMVAYDEHEQAKRDAARHVALMFHFIASALGLFFLLMAPSYSIDRLFKLSAVPLRLRVIRYFFWALVMAVKFLLALKVVMGVWSATQLLEIICIGRQTPNEIIGLWRASNWASNFYEWVLLWTTAFFLFCADTCMWFQFGCMILGVCITFVQRGCHVLEFMFQDELNKIPQRFSDKILPYAKKSEKGGSLKGVAEYLPSVWDRIIAYMRYEDKCDSQTVGDFSFSAPKGSSKKNSRAFWFENLQLAANPLRQIPANSSTTPVIFDDMTVCSVIIRNYFVLCNNTLPNADMKWRTYALARGLGLPIPRPYRAPYIPGITVLIPHYGETIILPKNELYDKGSGREKMRTHVKCTWFKLPVRETVPLIDWLKARYSDEWGHFVHRMAQRSDWPPESSWKDFNDEQWEKICVWASMRMQTLWRTVAGMMLYYPALEVHHAVQKLDGSSMSTDGVWNPTDCFNCIVSMQIYRMFNKAKLADTNKMFDKFPDALKVAFIDWEDVPLRPKKDEKDEPRNEAWVSHDRVHQRQHRRWFSCLIDKNCMLLPDGRRQPRYRVELPGFPILGDGKSDNQNHAIIFMRGIMCQCIDANQGAYFEQMLMLPCVLGEFRNHARGKGRAKRILGLPEHITSDFGSIGDFAAGSEIAFGTISQRSFALLGGRMHYGHPDMMNKQYMIQQGGVSKATKTINLSEDIFAGMDFTLRGQGREIKHAEYFHLAKGRDLGFNAVLSFFSKLANGTGEQLLTRQVLRLSHVLQLPESLTFYYAHAGYYITQYLVSVSMPLIVFVWLLVVCADCNRDFRAFSDVSCNVTGAESMAAILATWYSAYILFFLVVTSLPLFAEVWMQRNFGSALVRWVKQLLSCSFLLFIFQAKIIGYYIMAEIRQGGASYVATGRGLPTDRRGFVGAPSYIEFKVSVSLRGLIMKTLGGALRDAVLQAVKRAVVAALGGPGDAKNRNVGAEDVEVECTENGRLVIKVTPCYEAKSIPMKDKLTSPAFADAIVKAVTEVPGISQVCSQRLVGTATLEKSVSGWHIEQVGGLYLDYTQHTYYHGMALLFLTGLLFLAGGHSEAGAYKAQLWWTYLALSLVIFSWLHAPFIFNPYQFSAGYLVDDVKAWWGLFFRSGGENWGTWFWDVILKPKRGLSSSIFDFELIFMFFTVTAWVSVLYQRQVSNECIWSQDVNVRYATLASLTPPFALSFCFCLGSSLVERIMCCRAGRSRVRKPKCCFQYGLVGTDSDTDPSSSDEEGGASPAPSTPVPPVDGRHTQEDAQAFRQKHRWCQNGMPLAISGLIIAFLEVVELLVPLSVTFSKTRDYKALVAGVMVKFMFWHIIMFLLSSALSMKTCCTKMDECVPCLKKSVEKLVYGNGIARDMFVSGFIFMTMTPWVVINIINDLWLPRYSLHQTLIYRTPGPLGKKQISFDGDSDSSGSDCGSSSESEGSAGAFPIRRRTPSRTDSRGPPGASQTWFPMRRH